MTDASKTVLTLSVVIPVYNQRSYIEDAIRSVLTQDRAVQVIIVVDDGSTDADYRELESLYERVRVIRIENRGVSYARNLGAARADTNVVTFLDADDVWLPGSLDPQMTYLEENSSVAAVFSDGYYWFPTRGESGRETWPFPDALRSKQDETYRVRQMRFIDLLCGEHLGSIGSFFIRKAAFTSLGGFDERLRYAEDHELFIRASRSYRIDLLDMPGMLYRQHAMSATHTFPETNYLADVMVNAVQRYGLERGNNEAADRSAVGRRLASVHFAHGYGHFWTGSQAIARREFWQSCKHRLDFRTLAYFFATVTPGGRTLARSLKKLIRR